MTPSRRFKICIRCRENREESMIEMIKETAPRRDAECLSDEYIDQKSPMKWKCMLCEYEWEASYAAFKASKTCFRCRTVTKYCIKDIQKMAEKKGAKCNDEEYKNVKTLMSWECLNCNFQWQAKIGHFGRQKGCSNCQNGNKKYTIESIYKMAEERDIICLDTNYERSDKLMMWQCGKCDYFWETSLCNFTRSKGCPRCEGNGRYSLEEVSKLAKEKDISCLETNYVNCDVQMDWKCDKCSREWKTTWRSLNQNIGCIKCTFKESMNLNLDDVYKEIENRGIICLDDGYKNIKTKMNWECMICHRTWKTAFNHLRHSKSGCPHCASFKTEKICRDIFEDIMKLHFPKKRLKVLQGLELDGYNEDTKIAFEYDGKQHIEEVPFFHRKKDSFSKLRERDRLKDQLCIENDIYLVRIPHTYDFKNTKKLRDFILSQFVV